MDDQQGAPAMLAVGDAPMTGACSWGALVWWSGFWSCNLGCEIAQRHAGLLAPNVGAGT